MGSVQISVFPHSQFVGSQGSLIPPRIPGRRPEVVVSVLVRLHSQFTSKGPRPLHKQVRNENSLTSDPTFGPVWEEGSG